MPTIQDRLQFIGNLDVSDTRHITKSQRLAPQLLAVNQPSAFVAGGSVVSFVAGVSEQARSDVLNSTLLAQLAANKKHDRDADPRGWYRFYANVLENVGWTLQGFNFTRFNASGGSFTCERAVIDILAAIAGGGGGAAVVATTLAAMKNMSARDGRLVLFERESHNLHQANFQVSFVTEVNGAIAMGIAALEFSSSQRITRVLFFTWETSSSQLHYAAQPMTLNTDVYGQVRAQVVEKLGDRAQEFIQELEI